MNSLEPTTDKAENQVSYHMSVSSTPSNEKIGWVEVKSHPYRFVQWSQVPVGGVISGLFAGFHLDKFGLRRLLLRVDKEVLSLALPKVLKAKVCGENEKPILIEGNPIRIEYLGFRSSPSTSVSYHDFRVFLVKSVCFGHG